MMRIPQNEDDGVLLRRMRTGDEAAFTALYRRHQGAVYRFALQMSGKPEVAEEVTQEVFLALMRMRTVYDSSRGPLAAYLYGIARNHVLRHLEEESAYSSGSGDATGDQIPSGEDLLEDLTRGERLEALRQAILNLPAPYREIVVLCELHELDYREAAAVLGCPVGTVRSRLHRARTLLAWKLRTSEGCPV